MPKYNKITHILEKIIFYCGQIHKTAERFGNTREAFSADFAYQSACAIKFEIEEETIIPYFFDVIAYPVIKNEKLKEHIDNKGIILLNKTKEAV